MIRKADLVPYYRDLQANPIFGYTFYSFSNSLEFRVKRYQWYQSKVLFRPNFLSS